MSMKRFRLIHLLLAGLVLTAGAGCNQGGGEAETAAAGDPDALRTRDLAVGDGPEAAAGDVVSVHYTGWLYVNGEKTEKFDSSLDRGEPFVFQVGRRNVIQGWDQGIPGMKVGGRRELIIPPALGYGDRPAGSIPPNSTLIFEVELLDIPQVQVEKLATGTGPVAEEGDVVRVHYTGWVEEDGQKGSKFDSSVDRGEPFEFPLGAGRVIRGWDLGVKGMHVGDKVLLTIPPELAYGERGFTRGEEVIIPPAATLLFEVELLGVQGKQ
jgi:FKBP-type peptidyl-prolyl cis-trans isomerase